MSRTKLCDYWGAFQVPITVENKDALRAAMAEVRKTNPPLWAFLGSRKMHRHPTRETVERIVKALPASLQPFYEIKQHHEA